MSIPLFAVIGHPNEGKSSVVATLTENDQIRISPLPGETVSSTEYRVAIDGQSVIAFVDTPGFQNPLQTLGWMRKYSGPAKEMLDCFLDEFAADPGMAHECELLRPVAQGAGIIYVVDASRPLRKVDRAEMEILRLTGRPRMAILNCKTGEEEFLDEWKEEFRKHFNMVRVFNALSATFAERMRLLECLRSIDQDWEPVLRRVVDAFQTDWNRRLRESAALCCRFVAEVLAMSESAPLKDHANRQALEQRLTLMLEERIRTAENRLQASVKALFRHNVFEAELPEQSVLQQDLFSTTTWNVLGLSRKQLVLTATAAGSAAGVALDLATLGHSLGAFAAMGGAAAGLAALMKGERLTGERLLGRKLGGHSVQVGPVNTVQWVFILLDRYLLYVWHATNWAHARRQEHLPVVADHGKIGLTSTWCSADRKVCAEFFSASTRGKDERARELEIRLAQILEKAMQELTSR